MAQSPKSTQTNSSTQAFLPIKEIRDNVVILKNDTMRTVIMVKASGFDLKSGNEQEAIISSFEGFINSLTFPVQILMRSKKVDLKPYLEMLAQRSQTEENDLLASQIEDYMDFVNVLTENYNIMSKAFYVIVPHNPGGFKKISFWSSLFGSSKEKSTSNFEQNKVAVLEKTDLLINELQNVGLRAVHLNTQELIELFYAIYNPSSSQGEKITNLADLTTPIVTKNPEDIKKE